MVHHFGSDKPEITLELKKNEKDKGKIVKFVNKEFVTDDNQIAGLIEKTTLFRSGRIYRIDSVIAGANRKSGVHTGPRGTSDNDLVSQLQKEIESLKKENVELKKVKEPA